MEFSIWNIINVFGALGLFIYGLKVMSEGIQRAAGKQLRNFLNRVTSSLLKGLLSGLLITSVIQSSSAASVLVVGFVNAGLMTVYQSLGIIFGINIGTTITSWIVSILGVSLSTYQSVLPLFILIVPLLFVRNKKLNAWGEVMVGFVLLIIGIFFMRENVPDINLINENFPFIETSTQYGFLSILLFVLFGIIFTVFLQSSSASIALTIVFCNRGWLDYDMAAAMVLGANIGTTSTAEFAALIGNYSAKHTARIHSLFNIFGVLFTLPLIGLILPFVDWIGLQLFYTESAYSNDTSIPLALSIFHTVFNVFNALVFMLIPGFLVRASAATLRKTRIKDEQDTFKVIEDPFNLPELTILGAQKEVAKFAGITKKMNLFFIQLFQEVEFDKQELIYEKLVRHEIVINAFQASLSQYLNKASADELSINTSQKMNALNQICLHLEQSGGTYLKMAEILRNKNLEMIWFNQQQRSVLSRILHLLNQQHKLIQDHLHSTKNNPFSEALVSAYFNEINVKIHQDSKVSDFNQDVKKESIPFFENILDNCHSLNNYHFKILQLIRNQLKD